MTVSPDSTQTVSPGTALRGVARVPALTVLWHSRLERVGERTLLMDAALGREVVISRFQPLFGPPGHAVQEPLGDVSVSRQPLSIWTGPEGVSLRFDQTDKVRVGGETLRGTRCVPAAALESGVVLELSSHVALVLHWVSSEARAASGLGLVGESDSMHSIRKQLSRVAGHAVPVLLLGESGTGKELLARALHELGTQRGGPFVAVNMAAIPAGTAAAALFGHTKGAFTGADAVAPGYFGLADRGTLFLDEVGATPPDIQAALLRVLETGELQTVGGARPRSVDVRVVAATDANLEEAVAKGRFLLPLLHRLRAYELRLPALRERREDIGRLLRHFLEREPGARPAQASGTSEPWLPARLVAELALSPLPGNVRELEHIGRRLLIDWGDAAQVNLATLTSAASVPAVPSDPAGSGRAQPRSSQPENARSRPLPSESELCEALEQSEWKPSRAARLLGVSRTTIYGLIRRSPTLAMAAKLSPGEIRQQLVANAGDLDQAARALRVSRRGLLLRLREIDGLGGADETPL
ncbi:MAG: sigma 54-interacting transcriptional regulator [Deltaproteobacteria bacterium]